MTGPEAHARLGVESFLRHGFAPFSGMYGAKPLRLGPETAASLAAGGDGTARAPYAGGAPRRCQKSASPQVTSRRPCHSAPHIFWRPTIPIPRGRPLTCIKERQSPQAPYPAAMPFTSRRFSGPHASGRLPYPGAAHARQQSPHVPTPQCGSSHTFAPFPHTLRRLPHLSIPWRNSPYKCQIPHRASKLHKIPHRTRRDQRSVHSNLRIQPAYADSLQQRGSSGNAQGAVPLDMGTTTVPSQHPPVGMSAYGRQPAETSDRFTQIPCDGGPCVSVTTASTSWGATACYGRA